MSNTPVSYSKKVKSWRDSRTKRQKEGRLSRGIDSRQPTPEHQRKRRYPLTRKRYRQPYFPFIPINSRFSLKIKPSVNLHPSPKPPPLTLLNFSTGGEAARREFRCMVLVEVPRRCACGFMGLHEKCTRRWGPAQECVWKPDSVEGFWPCLSKRGSLSPCVREGRPDRWWLKTRRFGVTRGNRAGKYCMTAIGRVQCRNFLWRGMTAWISLSRFR